MQACLSVLPCALVSKPDGQTLTKFDRGKGLNILGIYNVLRDEVFHLPKNFRYKVQQTS